MVTVENGSRPPQVHIMNNFLDKSCVEEMQYLLLEKMNWIKEKKYYPDERQHYTLSNLVSSKELCELDLQIKAKIHEELQKFYGQLLFIPRNLSYNRWLLGDYIDCHNDSGHPNGELIIEKRGSEPPPTPISEHFNEFASVVYLTEEFSGGELFFTNFDYSVKPSAGTVVSFPANHIYSHGVNVLTKGERLTMTLFWPGVKSICLSLAPEVYPDWWKRVANPELIWTVMPSEAIAGIDKNLLPPSVK